MRQRAERRAFGAEDSGLDAGGKSRTAQVGAAEQAARRDAGTVMGQINFWVVGDIAGKVADLNAARLRQLDGGGRRDAHLVGADNSHLGQTQTARVVTKKFPSANLQITHGHRKRLGFVNKLFSEDKKILLVVQKYGSDHSNETKPKICPICV